MPTLSTAPGRAAGRNSATASKRARAAQKSPRTGQVDLKAGDHVWVDCGMYVHHGIASSPTRIIHYLGKKGVYADGKIAETGLTAFSDGGAIRVRRHTGRKFDRYTSVDRARQRLGESKYNLAFNNCEHFVQWCIEGKSESLQVSVAANSATSLAIKPVVAAAIGVFGPIGLLVKLPVQLWSLYNTYKASR